MNSPFTGREELGRDDVQGVGILAGKGQERQIKSAALSTKYVLTMPLQHA